MRQTKPSKIQVGYGLSAEGDSFTGGVAAARQAVSELSGAPLSVVLVFCSVHHALEEVLGGIHSVVGDAPVLGVTTAGEICAGPRDRSVVVMVLASHYLNVRVGVGVHVSRGWRAAVAQATGSPEVLPFFSSPDNPVWRELTEQGKAAFGLLFSPVISRHGGYRSYAILAELKNMSGNRLPIFGGCAAEDPEIQPSHVLYGRRAYEDGMLIAVFETSLQFGTAMAHGFTPGDGRVTVTRAHDLDVLELDGEPAADVFARLLGSRVEELEGKHLTTTSGRPVGSPDPYGQYSINVADYFTPERGVRLNYPVLEGTVLTLMQADVESLVGAGQDAVRKALLRAQTSDPAAVIVFSCVLRRIILGSRVGEEISRIMEMVPGVPVAGFYSFGEQGISDDGVNRHQNEVISVLVLGRELSYAAQVAIENRQLRSELELRIAQQRRSEAALRESEQRLIVALAASNGGTFHHDLDSDVSIWDKKSLEIFGLSSEEFKGTYQAWADCIHPEDRASTEEKIWKVLNSETEDRFDIRYRIVRPDGEIRHIRAQCLVVRDTEGRPEKVSGVHYDDTDHKRAREERERLQAQLREARKMEAIATLAGGIAHEFNNALFGITGNIDLLEIDLPPGEAVRKRIDPIRRATLRMTGLTSQLLAYARGGRYLPRVVGLDRFVDDTLPLLRHRIDPDIRVETDLGGSHARVEVDLTQLQMVFSAVLINASEAIEGRGRIRIRTGCVEIADETAERLPALTPGRYVWLAIEDDGRGMNEETKNRVFEPFFTTKLRGRGLGMAAAYGVVSNHGGWIEVESELGRGTVVRIYLPAVGERREEVAEPEVEITAGEGTILVVEDEETVMTLNRELLVRLGYRILEATTGAEAVELARTFDGTINAAVLDIGLPDMPGHRVYQEMMAARPDLKVIVCSGYALEGPAQEILNKGAQAFLQKPYALKSLAAKIKKVLQ